MTTRIMAMGQFSIMLNYPFKVLCRSVALLLEVGEHIYTIFTLLITCKNKIFICLFQRLTSSRNNESNFSWRQQQPAAETGMYHPLLWWGFRLEPGVTPKPGLMENFAEGSRNQTTSQNFGLSQRLVWGRNSTSAVSSPMPFTLSLKKMHLPLKQQKKVQEDHLETHQANQ